MANHIYALTKQAWLAGTAGYDLDNDTTDDGPYCALVDTGTYTWSDTHDFYNDISGVVGTDQRIATPTIVGGLFDGGNLTYTSVSGATIEALVIYRHNTGANTTWPLVFYIEITQVTPNGGNITVTWNGSGIVQL